MDRLTILRLAAEADLDPRSARKALTQGPHSLRGRAGEKALAAMQRMGLVSSSRSAPPPQPSEDSAAE